jgi:membrane protein YdbS with pleckstrin-like domain
VSDTDVQWQSVSPRYRAELIVITGIAWLIILAASSVPLWIVGPGDTVWGWFIMSAVALIGLVVLGFIPRRVRALGYALREDDIVFRRGVIFQRIVAVPYGRLQLVDVGRGPIARALGLSQLSLVTAAASSGVSIPGLPLATADQLRDHLIALAETRRAGL